MNEENKETAFSRQVAAQAARKLKAKRGAKRSIWFGLGMSGLASENASRLAAMQRAEKNIDAMVGTLNQTFRRLRQTSIDEELFDVLSGYESLSNETTR